MNHGFIFSKDGTFVERKISGFCATPPISFLNYTGTWHEEPNGEIAIDVTFWGGRIQSNLRLLSLQGTTLRYRLRIVKVYTPGGED